MIALTWFIGATTSLIGLRLILNWNNDAIGKEFSHYFEVFLFECGQGILFWLLAFEFYTSAKTMEEILYETPQRLDKNMKFRIFGLVSGIYFIVQLGLVFAQSKFDNK